MNEDLLTEKILKSDEVASELIAHSLYVHEF